MPSRPDPARRNEHSRQAILAAAIALIGERGYEQVSIEAIAQRGGVGKQTIYRWWPSKGAVILEALARRVEEITPLPFPDSSNVVEDLRFQMLGLVQILNSPEFRAAYQAVVAAAQSDPDLSRANLDALIEPGSAAVRQLLARAQDRGELRADADMEALIDMLYGAIFYRLLLHTRPLEPEQVDTALDIALNGLR